MRRNLVLQSDAPRTAAPLTVHTGNLTTTGLSLFRQAQAGQDQVERQAGGLKIDNEAPARQEDF